jgi:Uma2 family endonuclease
MNAVAALDEPRRLWLRVEDFVLLGDSGSFADFSKAELIDGEILCMNAQFQRHSFVKSQLAFRVAAALSASAPELVVLVEVAVAMPPHDMPEPDIVVIRGPIGSGAVALSAVAMVVEVADTTLDIDLGRKAALYARAGVAEYWVADIEGKRIIRHDQPGATGYQRIVASDFGEPLVSATMPLLQIGTAGLV